MTKKKEKERELTEEEKEALDKLADIFVASIVAELGDDFTLKLDK